MSSLLQLARGPRLLQALCSGPRLAVSFRRSIYNPTLRPPSHTTGPTLQAPVRETSRPTLSTENFTKILIGDDGYDGLVPGKSKHIITKQTPEGRWTDKSPKQSTLELPPNHFAGRSIMVQANDVGKAWNQLQGVLKLNKIRQELRLTARHEKKGVKRRRLRSERWRRQFAHEVKQKVNLVNEIRLRDRMWGASRH